ncbi:MAG TPA: HlyD family efflux transporter periplasmic adaptor subunit [Rhizomicrobium sp.]|nr:HlyD family efflux transporter periplasmic adaptor subunit [Rhizomicrobium sp.]
MRRPLALALIYALLSAPALAADSNNTGAVGQITPAGGIIDLNASGNAIITSVRVEIGDQVKAGQLLATVRDDTANHEEAARQLDRAKKSAAEQVAAQEASVRQAEQQLAQAAREYKSYKALGPNSTSARDMGRAKDAVTNAELALKIEKSKLVVTRGNAANSVADATRQMKLATAAEEIRAPVDGTILFVDKRVGAHPNGPVVRMGDLRTMYVVCQVYEGDLLKLRRGMRATIKSATLPHPLAGTVESVGRIVDTRAKLGEVRIRLDHPDPANRLVGMEVDVVIAR